MSEHAEHHHEHHHEHEHEHHHEHGKSAEELYALMRYMTGHNATHTRELEELAKQVQAAGNLEVYDLIMEAVGFFDRGNEVLAEALARMPEKGN